MKYDLTKFNTEEKVRLLAGMDVWHIDDLGGKVYKVKVSDGPVGLRTHELTGDFKTIPATGYGIFIENMLNASQIARNELPRTA